MNLHRHQHSVRRLIVLHMYVIIFDIKLYVFDLHFLFLHIFIFYWPNTPILSEHRNKLLSLSSLVTVYLVAVIVTIAFIH